MNRKSWYSAQCIFLHSDEGHGPKQMYEERIVVLRAESMEAAIERAEKEAEKYCSDLNGCRYIGYVHVFALYDDEISDGSEIFSNMQRSELVPKEYLDLHYPDTPENCEAVGESHRWHNLDDEHSACYHCKVIQEGQTWK
jgi:hypothetical protein